MSELVEKLNRVINDCSHQIDCIDNDDYHDMWDTKDITNWNSIFDILTEVKEYLEKER